MRRGIAALTALAGALVLTGTALGARMPSPRLEGFFATRLQIVEDSDQRQSPGDVNERTFLFTATCRKGACNVKVKLKSGSAFETMLLKRHGSEYEGAKLSSFTCVDRLLEVDLRVTGSAKRHGVPRVTRFKGTFELTDTPKPDRPDCAGQEFHQLSTAAGSRVAQKPGARLQGAWQASLAVTGGSFPELVGDPLGETGIETWTFTPICAKGACDVIAVLSGFQDFFFPIVVYLTYDGAGRYHGLNGTADALTCNAAPVYPGYYGRVTYALAVTAGTATARAWEGTVTLHKEVTPAAIASGCGPGTIESIRHYTAAAASG